MSLFAVLAASAALSIDPAAYDPPPMRLNAVPLDFSTAVDVETFVARTVEESRAWCALHHAAATPSAGPAACERIMSDRAARALPWEARRSFVRAGGMLALHRRQR